MNDAVILLAQVYDKPEDKTLALIAADALEEMGCHTRRTALKTVATARRSERNADQMSEAAKLLCWSAPTGGALRMHVWESAGLVATDVADIIVVNGSRPPTATGETGSIDGHPFRTVVVRVGARWVIRAAMTLRVTLADDQDGADEQAKPKL